MLMTPPPGPPLVDLHDESPRRRVQARLLQIGLAALTVFATAWCYQIHIALGLTMTFLAKHILVEALKTIHPQPLTVERLREELLKTKDFDGVTGSLTITAERQIQRPLHVARWRNGILTPDKK